MTAAHGFTDAAAIRAEAMAAESHGDTVPPLTESDVRKLFGPPARPPGPPLAYRVGLLVVAIATIVLPLGYVSLVAGVALLTGWFAVANVDIAASGRVRNYVGPILIGAGLGLFLLKPLFAARRRTLESPSLDPDDEPVLHAFVQHVCATVGAPLPTRIDIDGDVNASASFRRGWRSFFGSDLVLTIGTPLFAGLTVSELGGVLAHEMGHFRQGWGMRLSYLIRSTNAWLYRVVHERDGWDEKLRKVSGWFLFGALTRLGVWLTRRVLWVLMRIGQLLASTMSRQMELDADRHELALVGPHVLTAALRKLVLLAETQDAAHETANAALRDGVLPDDLTALTLDFRSRMKDDFARKLLDAALESDTQVLATHPGTRDRIAHAHAHDGAGGLKSDTPARALLSDAAAVQRRVTLAHYELVAPGALEHVMLVPTARLLADNRQRRQDEEVGARTYRDTVAYVLPLRLDVAVEIPEERAALVAALQAARGDFDAASADAQRALSRFDQADTRIAHAHRIERMLSAGGDPDDLQDLVIDERTAEAAATARVSARAAQRKPRLAVEAAHAALRRRIACTERLVEQYGDALELPGTLRERLERALSALRALSPLTELLDEVRFESYAVVDLAKRRAEGDDTAARDAVAAAEERTRRQFTALREGLGDAPHPVRAGTRFIDGVMPDPDVAIARPLDAIGRVLDNVWLLYFRGLDVLARAVDHVETACAPDAAE